MGESAAVKSLHTDFSRKITRKFSAAIERYNLLKSGDSVLVYVAPERASMLLAVLLRDFERHGNVPISVHFAVPDPEDFGSLKINSELLDLPPESFVKCPKIDALRDFGCNKIALPTHFDDVIEGIVSSMIFDGEARAVLPKQREDFEMIRPLYLVRERDITAWQTANELPFSAPEPSPERELVKRLIERLCEGNGQVAQNIFRSVCGVRLDRIISYNDGKSEHSFLDGYDD